MAIEAHLMLLKRGVEAWNAWRDANPLIHPDLSEADLNGAYLSHVDFSWTNLGRAGLREADLKGANLSWAELGNADLSGADLRGADFLEAHLAGANLTGASLICSRLHRGRLMAANLSGADLCGADLSATALGGADLSGADLSGADLRYAMLLNTNLTLANLSGCRVHGVSAWNLNVEKANQQNLIITEEDEPEITVDNIEIAQFLYLLLRNQKLRDVIDTITAKAVLIMGSFANERKTVLHALREELRTRDYLPILFDFEKPKSRDTDETITLLARMARFVIADVSDSRSVLQELRAIVPDLPSVPVQPIILATQEEPGMFDFYRNRPSFLAVHRYADQEQLLANIGDKVIRPAEMKVLELRG
jgi:Pentapeptide repeats (8 copies)